MGINLEQQDYYVLGIGFILWVALSYVSHMMGWPIQVEQLFSALAALAGLVSIYFIYRYLNQVGGDVGRYFALMGMGIIYYTLTLIPHVLNHIQRNRMITVYFFQHIMVAWSFVMIAYGAYLFYRGGQ
ncbi:MAG: hypothetical protein SVU32_02895 [Candidatus Nanohaloarchaea archaeon]|nr:hypothetical protein [Candidatus Nanohaloarchaea archaeon]